MVICKLRSNSRSNCQKCKICYMYWEGGDGTHSTILQWVMFICLSVSNSPYIYIVCVPPLIQQDPSLCPPLPPAPSIPLEPGALSQKIKSVLKYDPFHNVRLRVLVVHSQRSLRSLSQILVCFLKDGSFKTKRKKKQSRGLDSVCVSCHQEKLCCHQKPHQDLPTVHNGQLHNQCLSIIQEPVG